MNRYTSVGKTTYEYDPQGNLTSDGTNTYSYDYDNRLVTVIPAQAGIQNVSYAYDAFGRRIQKNINGEITNYCYDGDDIIAEYNTEGELTAKYIHGANTDEILCAIRYTPNANTYYYHHDGLGSVSEITDEIGNVIEKYTYDIYGTVTIKNASNEIIPTSSIRNRYYFTGRELDEETGLYYTDGRYYSPNTGRVLNKNFNSTRNIQDNNPVKITAYSKRGGGESGGVPSSGGGWGHAWGSTTDTSGKTIGIGFIQVNQQE